eukprot:Skav229336  [mRNA]  locus=scaffold2596:91376:100627:+ [translate_table: standard]
MDCRCSHSSSVASMPSDCTLDPVSEIAQLATRDRRATSRSSLLLDFCGNDACGTAGRRFLVVPSAFRGLEDACGARSAGGLLSPLRRPFPGFSELRLGSSSRRAPNGVAATDGATSSCLSAGLSVRRKEKSCGPMPLLASLAFRPDLESSKDASPSL